MERNSRKLGVIPKGRNFEGHEGQRTDGLSVRYFRWYFSQTFGIVVIQGTVASGLTYKFRHSTSTEVSRSSAAFLLW